MNIKNLFVEFVYGHYLMQMHDVCIRDEMKKKAKMALTKCAISKPIQKNPFCIEQNKNCKIFWFA